MKFHVLYYTDENGKCDIDDFLNSLKMKNRAKAIAWIDKLEEKGNQLHRPYSDYLRDGIYELRLTLSSNNIRILYFFIHRSSIILSHAFSKQTRKVPEKEIDKTLKRKKKYLRRIRRKNEKT
ncbi:MAG: type II toxin-antitoxin system RelE/ParE family toxin [candidate division WOR-3 bacterium]|nr:type II toxin-antitoxin system RelE/ParE family toxin [candidate division WOR-3 bacterium]